MRGYHGTAIAISFLKYSSYRAFIAKENDMTVSAITRSATKTTSLFPAKVSDIQEKVSEWFWFTLCFLLFVVLGPFSVPVVLMVLIQLGVNADDCQEPESCGDTF